MFQSLEKNFSENKNKMVWNENTFYVDDVHT